MKVVKTYAIKTTTLLLGMGLLTYVIWLFVQEAIVVAPDLLSWNMLVLLACVGVALYLV